MRLNKYLARCGISSRRNADKLIASGRITVNGKPVHPSYLVKPEDRVAMDGQPIMHLRNAVYLMLNKPRGYITTTHDQRGRPTVMDLIPDQYRSFAVQPIGRLDRDTEGLLLLTNDGDLAFRLTRPEYHIPRVYRVELDRPIAPQDLKRISRGIYVPQLEMFAKPVSLKKRDRLGLRLEITLNEGKKRQVRLMFITCGYQVTKLERIRIGPLYLRGVKRGSVRPLTKTEVALLKRIAGLS